MTSILWSLATAAIYTSYLIVDGCIIKVELSKIWDKGVLYIVPGSLHTYIFEEVRDDQYKILLICLIKSKGSTTSLLDCFMIYVF